MVYKVDNLYWDLASEKVKRDLTGKTTAMAIQSLEDGYIMFK